jgi:hypothetical protein
MRKGWPKNICIAADDVHSCTVTGVPPRQRGVELFKSPECEAQNVCVPVCSCDQRKRLPCHSRTPVRHSCLATWTKVDFW